MQVTAKMSPTYQWRLALFALLFLAFSGWSAYDGFVAYPQINAIADEFEAYKKNNSNWTETWPKYAREKGYKAQPDSAKRGFNLYAQYIMLAITLPVGTIALGYYLRSHRLWIGADETGLVNSSGQRAEFSSITKLNKDRWKNKGIAVVHYQHEGIERRLVLDDWKFDRQAVLEMLKLVEEKLPDDKINGDSRESAKTKPVASETAPE